MDNRKKLIYLVIGVATLIVLISGATYAYFMASQINNNTINGDAANLGLVLTVNKITPNNNDVDTMVPQLERTLGTAINSTNNCVDSNNNVVCQVYKATITNASSVSIKLNGTIAFRNISNINNLKWKLLDDATTVGSGPSGIASINNAVFTNDYFLTPSQSSDFYIAIWINEMGVNQVDVGPFYGTITFTTDGGDAITADFGNIRGVTNS